ncbi:MAG: ComF family protein [Lachnospiraceae bacterium]|nr:ComF family protein [Lachnospiraceae bacterium]
MQKKLYKLLYPRRCPGCDKLLEPDQKVLCARCDDLVKRTGEVVCVTCGKPLKNETRDLCPDCRKGHNFVAGRALFVYDGPMKEAMYRLKYDNRRCYARNFAVEAKKTYAGLMRAWGIECVVPIPMFAPKERKRGYNQARVLAQNIAEEFGLPVADLLERVEDTPPMKGLSPFDRRSNVKKAFHMKESEVQFNRILVVDDIFTTGATMDAVAEVLMSHGVQAVYALYVCIGEGS